MLQISWSAAFTISELSVENQQWEGKNMPHSD